MLALIKADLLRLFYSKLFALNGGDDDDCYRYGMNSTLLLLAASR